jgi:uncharacterized surface protein with fasciclin (FAS1) repeats
MGPDVTELDGDDEVPWYKKPAGIAAIVILVLAIIGLIAWFIWGGGDDESDEATPTSSRLIIETTDTAGAVIDVGFAVAVDGPADAPKAFVWLRPDGVAPGEIAGDNTGTDGRVDFEWEADSTVADPTDWNSTVNVIAQVPPGWTPPGPSVNCVRRPVDGPETAVVMNIELDSTDQEIARVGTATFPNYEFAPGDSVTCRLAAGAPVPTTVVDTTTPDSTTPETTTPETTVPETTPETTAAPTTAAPTTVAPTVPPTVPPVIAPPAADDTAWDVIESNPDLSGLKALVDAADPSVRELLEDPTATITLFAPSNEAIDAADIDLEDEAAVTALLLAHVDGTEALTAADVFDGRTSVVVLEGGPQPVDDADSTIGGATVLVADVEPVNGVIHVIDAVLSIQP